MDYENAVRFRTLGDKWDVGILEEPEHELSVFRYFNKKPGDYLLFLSKFKNP